MRRLIVCAALACAAVTGALGQDAGPKEGGAPAFVRLGDAGAEAARLLASAGNRERAWGAYLAGLYGLKSQAPALVSILEDGSLAGGGREQSLVRQSALDALIRLDAEVPAETLLPLYQSSPAEVVILLSRSPEKNRAALLSVFDDDAPAARWFAVGNLLAETRAPGFAARLLGPLRIRASVYVFDTDGPHGIGGGAGSGGGCGCGHASYTDDGFPPVGYYSLDDDPRRGSVVLARGPHVVYYTRAVGSPRCPCGMGFVDRDSARVEYLADMLGATAGTLDFEAYPWREVVCKDAARCRRALACVRDELTRSYASLLARLLDAGLLDGAEAAELRPDITLNLYDERARRSFPLPGRLRGVKLTLEGAADASPPPESSAPEATPPAR